MVHIIIRTKEENMLGQYNYLTQKIYQGKNQAELTNAKEKGGYISDAWVTFLQARELGLRIKKGSHGEHIFNGYHSYIIYISSSKFVYTQFFSQYLFENDDNNSILFNLSEFKGSYSPVSIPIFPLL